jgi:hypothetical protein
VAIAPAPFDDTQWAYVMSCVRREFGPFNITVTDVRPASGAYVEASVGGLSSSLSPSLDLLGIAPFNCGVTEGAVAFVFAGHPELSGSPKITCDTIAHEVGHTLGLEHSQIAADPMTYKDYAGDLSFQDQDAQCGGFSVEPCVCTQPLQNTFQRLIANIGPH